MATDGEWSEYQIMVLKELQYHHEALETVKIELSQLRVELARLTMMQDRVIELERTVQVHATEIAMLRVKAGLWGAGAGLLAALASVLMGLMAG